MNFAQTPGKPGPAFEDVAEKMAESPDPGKHCVPCPCPHCQQPTHDCCGPECVAGASR